jgi:hypothetical protein
MFLYRGGYVVVCGGIGMLHELLCEWYGVF